MEVFARPLVLPLQRSTGREMINPALSAGGGVSLSPLNAFSASSSPAAAWSLRKVNPAYVGGAVQIRTAASGTLTTIGFDGSGNLDDAALAAWDTANSGVDRLIRTKYDQSANARHLTSVAGTTGQRLMRASQGAGGKPSTKATAAGQALVTNAADGTGPFNIGGGSDNFTIIMSAGVNGYGGSTWGSSPPASTATKSGSLFGMSNTSTEFLAPTDGWTIQSTNVFGSMTVAASESLAEIERLLAPSRRRTIALKFEGQTVSAFVGTTKLWTRTLTVPVLAGVRFVLGNRGAANVAANAEVNECIVWQAALSDLEIRQIMLEMQNYWGATEAATVAKDIAPIVFGQSNAGYFETDAWPSFVSSIKSALGMSATDQVWKQINNGFANNSAFGGSAIQAGARDDTAAQGPTNYWREYPLQAGSAGRGPNAVTLATALNASRLKHLRSPIVVVIGEQEAGALAGSVNCPTNKPADPLYQTATATGYTTGLLHQINDMRTLLGQPDAPVLIIALGRTSSDAACDAVRQAQMDAAQTGANVYLISAANDAALRDIVHWATASLVVIGTRSGRKVANLLVPGSLAYDQGPSISGVAFTDGSRTAIRVTIAPTGGTDFTPTSDINSFRVVDAGGAKTISSAVRESATTIVVTLSTACSGATTIQYGYGQSYDPTKMVVDNAVVTGPLEVSRPLAVA